MELDFIVTSTSPHMVIARHVLAFDSDTQKIVPYSQLLLSAGAQGVYF